MRKIIEYAIIKSQDIQVLSEEVNRCIKDGWEVYGNLIGNTLEKNGGGTRKNYDTIYIQTIVKYKEKD